MKSTLIAAAIALVAPTALAYTLPSDQADGAYMVTFDESGKAINKRVELKSESTAEKRSTKMRVARDEFSANNPIVHSGSYLDIEDTNRNIDPTDYANAQECMYIFLDQQSGEWGKGVYYCRSGDALLAICQYTGTMYGSSAEVDGFNEVADFNFGKYVSGYVWIENWAKTYWRTTWGETICGDLSGPTTQI